VNGRSRRQFLRGGLALAGLGLLAGCGLPPPSAEKPARMPRVGYLWGGGGQEWAEAFRQALAEHGYVEGRTVVVEWRDVGGQADRLAELAADLVRLPVDVLVADGASATRAAREATDAIPIVMAQSPSPVEDGLVASLARPGGNVTGLTGISRELIGKRLELLKEAAPGVSRVGVLWNPGIADRAGEFRIVQAAAGPLGLELRSLEAREAGTLEAALQRALAERVEGLYLLDNLVLTSNVDRVGEFVRDHRLPMMSTNRSLAAAGGLLAYGVNRPALYRRAATYVDRILKGATPAELPVERPTTFDLVINLKTANALGLTIPPSVLQQATEVIQ
jgi:putative ABC transport system substrate-binding protein